LTLTDRKLSIGTSSTHFSQATCASSQNTKVMQTVNKVDPNAILMLDVPSPQSKVEYHFEGVNQLLATGPLRVYQTATRIDNNNQHPASSSEKQAPPSYGGVEDDFITISFLTIGENYTRPLLPFTNAWKAGDRGFIFPLVDDHDQYGSGNDEKPNGFHKIELGPDVSLQEVEEFEDTLAFTTVYARAQYKQSLAFVNTSGQVVGRLEDKVEFVEDNNVTVQPSTSATGAQYDHEDKLNAKTPVVISLDEQASKREGREIHAVHRATSNDLSDTIVNYSEILSESIVKGANLIGDGIKGGSNMITAYLSPNEKPLTFKPETKAQVMRAKEFTGSAVAVTAKVVETAVRMAMKVGSTVLSAAPTSSSNKSKGGVTSSVKNLGSKLAYAVGNVAHGVDQGARILWTASSSSTSHIVGHRYGKEAGTLTADALSIAENLTLVYFDSRGVSRRVIIRKAAGNLIKERAAKKKALDEQKRQEQSGKDLVTGK